MNVRTTNPPDVVLVGVHVAKYIAWRVVLAVGEKLLPAKTVVPVPSAFVFQPANVKPTLAKLPEFAATVTAAPPTELALAGAVPANVLAVAFAL